ncbi:hypothetical protein IWW49_001292 [Coemansia sp. RSA 1797]|nr:hypothetical protein IWW49_001292 [Coemansia sp. RSA 1797]
MTRIFTLLLLAATAVLACGVDVKVPACPSTTSFTFNTGIPAVDPSCPLTEFYYDASQTTNGDIWEYEVVEAFIYKGADDPQTYFEYEVNANNVTYNAFVYNPSRVRKEGAPFDHAFVMDPFGDGFEVDTRVNKKAQLWHTSSVIPLALFNGENPRGSTWRMNFFRTVTGPSTFPNQQLCGWKNTNAANFHITSAFGRVKFV